MPEFAWTQASEPQRDWWRKRNGMTWWFCGLASRTGAVEVKPTAQGSEENLLWGRGV